MGSRLLTNFEGSFTRERVYVQTNSNAMPNRIAPQLHPTYVPSQHPARGAHVDSTIQTVSTFHYLQPSKITSR